MLNGKNRYIQISYFLFAFRKKEVEQMAVKVDEEKCVGCGACVDVCPNGAITIENDKAKIDESKCIECGACIDTCPQGALSL
ncbi:MAG: 4Fe-4S dicluster domain-containing protein [Thermoplasmata archaeon]|nr:MAG: 4Fe-4S dicluster domain-containing protein [Thermoplasmata archaeon]KAA0010520.1 MAG: 4Fe-4S dicluster domain-containing protein [Thermoplasmata archaeon]